MTAIFTLACNHDSVLNVSSEEKIFATVEDDLGNKLTLNKKPEKIVVTSASFLDPLHLMNANIVGRPDSKNKTPDWAKDIPSIGKVYQIDVEKILACNPDLVIINRGMNEKLLGVLAENRIPCIVVETKTYQNFKHTLENFAKLTDNIEKGNKIKEKMDNDIRQIVEKLPKIKRRAAVIHSTAQGLSLQLDDSIAGNILNILGWENVATEAMVSGRNNNSTLYSLEFLAEQNPEIIFVTSMGNYEEIKSNMQEIIASNEAWQTIPAIKNNQIYYLSQDLFLLSPGLDYPKAVKTMAELIYPDIFR